MAFLSKSDIEKFLTEKNLFDEDTDFIWVTSGNSYFIISFCKNGLALVPITPLGDFRGDIDLLEKENIDTIEFKKKILGYKLKITAINSEKYSFVVRPFMISYKGQKESIKNIMRKIA